MSDKSKIIEATEVGLRGAPHVRFDSRSKNIRAGVLDLIVACGLKREQQKGWLDNEARKEGRVPSFCYESTMPEL